MTQDALFSFIEKKLIHIDFIKLLYYILYFVWLIDFKMHFEIYL